MTDIMEQINRQPLNEKSSELMFWGFFHIIQATAYIIKFCCQNILLPFHSKNQLPHTCCSHLRQKSVQVPSFPQNGSNSMLYYNDISWHNQKIVAITCHLSNTMKLIYSDTVLICSILGNLHLQFFEH